MHVACSSCLYSQKAAVMRLATNTLDAALDLTIVRKQVHVNLKQQSGTRIENGSWAKLAAQPDSLSGLSSCS